MPKVHLSLCLLGAPGWALEVLGAHPDDQEGHSGVRGRERDWLKSNPSEHHHSDLETNAFCVPEDLTLGNSWLEESSRKLSCSKEKALGCVLATSCSLHRESLAIMPLTPKFSHLTSCSPPSYPGLTGEGSSVET